MTKILILNGDTLEQEIRINPVAPDMRERFIFILTEKRFVYHLDTTDGRLYQALKDLSNLGKGHKKIIQEAMKK